MPTIKRIALFAYPDALYVNQLVGLKRAFESLAVETHVGWPWLEGPAFENFIDHFRPDAVFEIDRFRNQIPSTDTTFIHIAWVQNHFAFGRRIHERAGGSQLVYDVFDLSLFGFPKEVCDLSQRLLLGVDPNVFRPDSTGPIYDMSMIGHMYEPLADDVLNTVISVDGREICRLREMMDAFLSENLRHTEYSTKDVSKFIKMYYSSHGASIQEEQIPPALRYIFDEYLIRLVDRKMVADSMLRVSQNIAFFGNPGWTRWMKFAPFYQRQLVKASDLAAAYRATQLNVHNGRVTMHFRPLEAMACGRPVLVNRTSFDETPEGIAYYFEPGTHYIPFDFDDFDAAARAALSDSRRLNVMGELARQRVCEGHTWRHRAEQILADLSRV